MTTTGPDMVVAGEEITMRRQELGALDARMFGAPEHAAIVEDWREQHGPEMPTLHLTLVRTVQERHIVVIWAQQVDLSEELRRHSLPLALAVDLFGIGELDVHNEDDARLITRGLVGMVASADLPWPPEDHVDTERWRTAESALYRAL